MLDKEAAISRAAEYLAAKSEEWGKGGEVRLSAESAFLDGEDLVVCYDTIAYLDHGDEMERLAGNNPIKVDLNTGECHFIPFVEALEYMNKGLI
ncbi:YrhB family protein [Streptomyces sp. NBC_01775]|uniref:YrhB domain-containing protein n=1 Tax=Streptomyces sp. NBC_01775 TaxID=2975939 RepID=UPI002DDB0B80|nr:YrhB domain-containing protein [Streptomyces sp. NBC_01775]WSB75783.1 YrhB family protein [Streptomyces sp. NBC_01775]